MPCAIHNEMSYLLIYVFISIVLVLGILEQRLKFLEVIGCKLPYLLSFEELCLLIKDLLNWNNKPSE